MVLSLFSAGEPTGGHGQVKQKMAAVAYRVRRTNVVLGVEFGLEPLTLTQAVQNPEQVWYLFANRAVSFGVQHGDHLRLSVREGAYSPECCARAGPR